MSLCSHSSNDLYSVVSIAQHLLMCEDWLLLSTDYVSLFPPIISVRLNFNCSTLVTMTWDFLRKVRVQNPYLNYKLIIGRILIYFLWLLKSVCSIGYHV